MLKVAEQGMHRPGTDRNNGKTLHLEQLPEICRPSRKDRGEARERLYR